METKGPLISLWNLLRNGKNTGSSQYDFMSSNLTTPSNLIA